MSVISVEAFKSKATRIIEIDGFEPDEKFEIRIKSVSMLGMIAGGKLPNNLLATIDSLFAKGGSKQQVGVVDTSDMSADDLKTVMSLIDTICNECMIEPTFKDIGEYMTDNQKSQVMTEAMGGVNALIPFVQK